MTDEPTSQAVRVARRVAFRRRVQLGSFRREDAAHDREVGALINHLQRARRGAENREAAP